MKEKWQYALILLIFTWLQYNYLVADYKSFRGAWDDDNLYYLWDKGKDFIFALIFYKINRNKQLKECWGWLASFFLCRVYWQIIAMWKGLDVNGQLTIAILFTIIEAIICIIAIYPLIKDWKKSHL